MSLVLVFGALLVIAVLISDLARSTVLSTSVLFLVAGLALGPTWLNWVQIGSSQKLVARTAELALFTILFVDGSQLSCREIGRAWRLPGRALLIGIPVTIAALAIAAHVILGIDWLPAVLLGAVLSPTDPVMVRTILEHEAVPLRLRQLLSVESGLNDGLALPPIVIVLALLGVSDAHPLAAVLQAIGGIAIGVVVGSFAALERVRWLAIAKTYRPLLGVAVACTVFGVCELTGANELLGAFAAGVTVASTHPDRARDLVRFGEPLSEAVKLAALLVFGVNSALQLDFPIVLFAAITLLAARPLALLFAFIGNGLTRPEWFAAAWFGPKGFASLLFATIVLASGIADGPIIYTVVGVVVAVSVLAHASTDSLVARTFARRSSEREQ